MTKVNQTAQRFHLTTTVEFSFSCPVLFEFTKIFHNHNLLGLVNMMGLELNKTKEVIFSRETRGDGNSEQAGKLEPEIYHLQRTA